MLFPYRYLNCKDNKNNLTLIYKPLIPGTHPHMMHRFARTKSRRFVMQKNRYNQMLNVNLPTRGSRVKK